MVRVATPTRARLPVSLRNRCHVAVTTASHAVRSPNELAMRLTSLPRTSLLVIALLAARTTVAGAQSPSSAASSTAAGGSVRGTLVDAQSGQPIDHASVAVRSGATVVSGANLQGASSFNVQGLRPGTYSLRITSMGFSPLTREITVTSASPVVSLGTIK